MDPNEQGNENNGVDSEEHTDPVEDRLAAIEELLIDIKNLLDPAVSVQREQAAHFERHAKVPFVPPEMPAGLSPNEKLGHAKHVGATSPMGNPVGHAAKEENEDGE